MTDVLIFEDSSVLLLAGVYDPSITGKGNPWHDPRTGRFTFGPPGVKILRGVQNFRMMKSEAKRLIDQRTKLFHNRVDGIIADDNGEGGYRIHMFVGGKLVDSFDAPGPGKPGKLKKGDEAIDTGIPASDPRRVEYEHVMRDLRSYGEYLQTGEKKSDDPFKRHLSPDERDRQQDLRDRLSRLINDGVFRRDPQDILEEIELSRAAAGRKHFNESERRKLQRWRDSLTDMSDFERAAERVEADMKEDDAPAEKVKVIIDNDRIEDQIRNQVSDLVPEGIERDDAQDALIGMYHEAYDKANARLVKKIQKADVDKNVVGPNIFVRVDMKDPLMEIEEVRRFNKKRVWSVHVGDPDYEYAATPGFTVFETEDGYRTDDMLTIDDKDFFENDVEFNEYAKIVGAVRGQKATGNTTLFRAMSPDEYDAWKRGEQISTGKWFTTEMTDQRAADIDGVFPTVYRFHVPNDALFEVDEGSFQLTRPMVLKNDTLHDADPSVEADFDKPDVDLVRQELEREREWVAPPPPKSSKLTRQMQVKRLRRYRQYDVPASPYSKLEKSLKKEGVKDPILLHVDEKGYAYISDGNHRLAAMERLQGEDAELPVVVKKIKSIPEGAPRVKLLKKDRENIDIKAGGYSSDKSYGTNTRLGEEGEKIFAHFTGGEQLNEGKDRRGAFDVTVDGYAFEVKANSVHATEYKATPKDDEIDRKRIWSSENGFTPAIAMPIIDTENDVTYIYWRPGLKGGRLSKNTGWKYLGSVKNSDVKDLDVPEPNEYVGDGPDVDAVDKLKETRVGPDIPGLEDKMEEYIPGLGDGNITALNGRIRNNKLEGDDKELIAGLDRMLEDSVSGEEFDAWRGTNSTAIPVPILKGAEWNDNEFSSWSWDKDVAGLYARPSKGPPVILHVKAPKGTHAVKFLFDDDFDPQRELFFQRGTRWRIDSVKKKGGEKHVEVSIVDQPGEVAPEPQPIPRSIVPDDTSEWALYGNTELVWLEELWPYKEFERGDKRGEPGSRDEFISNVERENIEKIKASIREEGMKEPIIVDYGLKDEKMYVSEGNRRLAAARELGYKEVPVRVITAKDTRGRTQADYPPITPTFEGHIPTHIKPSDVGLSARRWDATLEDPLTDEDVTYLLNTSSEQWGKDLNLKGNADAWGGLKIYRLNSGYTRINAWLRKGTPVKYDRSAYPEGMDVDQLEKDANAEMIDHIHGIDKAIEMSPPLSDPIRVYRGINSVRAINGQRTMKRGDRIDDDGFVSTTTHLEFAASYAEGQDSAILEIVLPEGTKGAWMPANDGMADGGNNEFVLPRGMSFEVVSKRVDVGTPVYEIRPVPRQEGDERDGFDEAIARNEESPDRLQTPPHAYITVTPKEWKRIQKDEKMDASTLYGEWLESASAKDPEYTTGKGYHTLKIDLTGMRAYAEKTNPGGDKEIAVVHVGDEIPIYRIHDSKFSEFTDYDVGKLDPEAPVSEEHAQDLLDEAGSDWYDGLGDLEISALKDYRSVAGYKETNAFLRDEDVRQALAFQDPVAHDTLADRIDDMDSAISKWPGVDQEMVVYRGIEHLPKEIAKMVAGDEFSDDGFTSVTTRLDAAADYTGYSSDGAIVQITIPPMTKGAWMPAGEFLNDAGNMEFVLGRGHRFEIEEKFDYHEEHESLWDIRVRLVSSETKPEKIRHVYEKGSAAYKQDQEFRRLAQGERDMREGIEFFTELGEKGDVTAIEFHLKHLKAEIRRLSKNRPSKRTSPTLYKVHADRLELLRSHVEAGKKALKRARRVKGIGDPEPRADMPPTPRKKKKGRFD